MNYTPLRFPLKTQSGPALGIIPVITFSVLLIAAAVITGAYLFAKTNQYNAKRNPEELQKYSVSRGTNIAATVAARVALGVNAPTITDVSNNLALQKTIQSPTSVASVSGEVAGVATEEAIFRPITTASFPKCFNSQAVNPAKDVMEVSYRCPLYIPKGTSKDSLSVMEDANSVSLLDDGTVIYTLKKAVPEGQAQPECLTFNDFMGSGSKKECKIIKVEIGSDTISIDSKPANSSLVESMTCTSEDEKSCRIDSNMVVVQVDGGIFLTIPKTTRFTEDKSLDLVRVK